MKESFKIRNKKRDLTILCSIFLSSLIMLIENLTVSDNEALAVCLYIAAFAFAVFNAAVRAVSGLLERRLTDAVLITIAAFTAFLLGYYQSAVLSALLYEYIRMAARIINCKLFSKKTKTVRILSDSKQTVSLSALKKGDTVLINAGECPFVKCTDKVNGETLGPLDKPERDTVAEVIECESVCREHTFAVNTLQNSKKISFLASVALIIAVGAVYMIIGVKSSSVTVSVYKLLCAILCLPYSVLCIDLSSNRANIVLSAVYFAVCAVFTALIYTGFVPMWTAVLIKCVLQSAMFILKDNKKILTK